VNDPECAIRLTGWLRLWEDEHPKREDAMLPGWTVVQKFQKSGFTVDAIAFGLQTAEDGAEPLAPVSMAEKDIPRWACQNLRTTKEILERVRVNCCPRLNVVTICRVGWNFKQFVGTPENFEMKERMKGGDRYGFVEDIELIINQVKYPPMCAIELSGSGFSSSDGLVIFNPAKYTIQFIISSKDKKFAGNFEFVGVKAGQAVYITGDLQNLMYSISKWPRGPSVNDGDFTRFIWIEIRTSVGISKLLPKVAVTRVSLEQDASYGGGYEMAGMKRHFSNDPYRFKKIDKKKKDKTLSDTKQKRINKISKNKNKQKVLHLRNFRKLILTSRCSNKRLKWTNILNMRRIRKVKGKVFMATNLVDGTSNRVTEVVVVVEEEDEEGEEAEEVVVGPVVVAEAVGEVVVVVGNNHVVFKSMVVKVIIEDELCVIRGAEEDLHFMDEKEKSKKNKKIKKNKIKLKKKKKKKILFFCFFCFLVWLLNLKVKIKSFCFLEKRVRKKKKEEKFIRRVEQELWEEFLEVV